jgi:hypothetical protein
MLLALQLPETMPHANTLFITLDNQAAICVAAGNERQPGQYLLDEFHDNLKALRRGNCRLRVHIAWVPGHEDIAGNELADTKAKEASQGTVSPPEDLPLILRNPLPASISALRAQHKEKMHIRWGTQWQQSPRYRRITKIDSSLPSTRPLKLFNSLPRCASSILVQLCTGHVALNTFLKKIKAVQTALCLTCQQPETVTHFLIHCKRYHTQRKSLKREVGKAANSVAQLLGHPKVIRSTLKFIAATRRFKDYIDIIPQDKDPPR